MMHQSHSRRSLRMALTHLTGVDDTGESRDNQGPAWLQPENVIGIGIGKRQRDGKTMNETCLRVYVQAKRKETECPQPIPRHVTIEGLGTFSTDIHEEPMPVAFSNIRATRPLEAGYSVGSEHGSTGTIGSTFHYDGNDYLLSCSHVIAECGYARGGAQVFQPASSDLAPGLTIGNVYGRSVTDFSQMGNYDNRYDFALARLTVGANLTDPDLLKASNYLHTVNTSTGVKKNGRTTMQTEGQVVDPVAHITMEFQNVYRDGAYHTYYAEFGDLIQCTCFAEPGDSGALVLSTNGKIVGLCLGGNISHTYVLRSKYIREFLNTALG